MRYRTCLFDRTRRRKALPDASTLDLHSEAVVRLEAQRQNMHGPIQAVPHSQPQRVLWTCHLCPRCLLPAACGHVKHLRMQYVLILSLCPQLQLVLLRSLPAL